MPRVEKTTLKAQEAVGAAVGIAGPNHGQKEGVEHLMPAFRDIKFDVDKQYGDGGKVAVNVDDKTGKLKV